MSVRSQKGSTEMFTNNTGVESQAPSASSEPEVAGTIVPPRPPRLEGLPGTTLAWALAYAEAGWCIFPCRADKTPLTPKGFKDAVADLPTIKAWWAKWPHAEIGWAIPEGLLAVDLDEKHGFHGTRDFAQLTGVEADDYPAPSTVSPSGGRHLFFGTNGKTYGNIGSLNGLGIDVRAADKGYVCLPGPSNGRRWVRTFAECQPPPAPDWVPTSKVWAATGAPGPSPFFHGETSAAKLFLDDACADVAHAPNGRQEATLNRQCLRVGGVIAGGGLQYDVAFDALLAAALGMQPYRPNEPWVARDLRPKIARCLDAGAKSPWLPREVDREIDKLQAEWASDENQERLFREMCEAVPELFKRLGIATGSAANENQASEPGDQSRPEPEPSKPEAPKPEAKIDAKTAPGAGGTNRTNQPAGPSSNVAKGADIVCAADIVMRPKDWLWAGHLLRGAQELLTGIPGLGKSQVQINFVACLTAGLSGPMARRPPSRLRALSC